MKTEYLMSIESSESLLEEIGAQALTTAAYQPPDTIVQTIDAVTKGDVVKVSAFTVKIAMLYVNLESSQVQLLSHHHFSVVNVGTLTMEQRTICNMKGVTSSSADSTVLNKAFFIFWLTLMALINPVFCENLINTLYTTCPRPHCRCR